MKKVLIFSGLLLGAAQLASAAAPMPEGDASAGEAETAICAACHGADGNSAELPEIGKASATKQ